MVFRIGLPGLSLFYIREQEHGLAAMLGDAGLAAEPRQVWL